MEICEDGGCPGQPKAGPTTKGQAGDGPEAVELAPVPAPAPGVESKAEVELEKMRMEFELTRLKYLHAENERQRQHQQAMERLQQQVAVRQVGGQGALPCTSRGHLPEVPLHSPDEWS